jgi:hypothetical protein
MLPRQTYLQQVNQGSNFPAAPLSWIVLSSTAALFEQARSFIGTLGGWLALQSPVFVSRAPHVSRMDGLALMGQPAQCCC